jgi:hypothetical protein
MRPFALALLLPLAAVAQDAEPTFSPDRSLLRRQVIPSEELCPTWINSKEFRVQRGEAAGRLKGNAIAEARENGATTLAATLCQGQERSPRCLAALRNIAPVGPGEWQKRGVSGWACASVAIEEKLLNSQQHDLEALDGDLAGLAQALRNAAGAAPLQLLTPRWQDTGCPAGEVGAQLLVQLRQHLGGAQLVDPGQHVEGAQQLRLDLVVASERLSLAASARAIAEEAWTALDAPAVTFPSDLFRLEARDARSCPAEDELGLPGGDRPGAYGLEVQLFAAGPEGLFCAGEQLTPRVELSGPARVRVFTLQADGVGFAVWPHQPQDDRVYGPADPPALPPFTATRSFDGSDSRLLVAAFPEGGDAPPAGFCRLAAPLQVDALEGAAVASATYHVAAAGERLCLDRGDNAVAGVARDHAEAAITQAPTCAIQ